MDKRIQEILSKLPPESQQKVKQLAASRLALEQMKLPSSKTGGVLRRKGPL